MKTISRVICALAATVAIAASSACATAKKPAPEKAPAATPAAQQDAAKPKTPAKPAVDPNKYVSPYTDYKPEPPDGKWLVDDLGREYFVMDIPKVEGLYLFESPTRVRINTGVSFDIVNYDDKVFHAKVYKPGDPTAPTQAPPPPTAAEIAAIDETYKPDTKESKSLTFEAIGAGLPDNGQWRNGFALADMNGDGNLDIVHGPPRRGTSRRPVIYLGDGKGGFTYWKEAKFPAFDFDYGDVAVSDFDRDGALDIALAVHLRGIVVLKGDGKGVFTAWSHGLPWGNPAKMIGSSLFSSRAIAAADWNGDGRPDIIAVAEGPATASPAAGLAYASGKKVFLSGSDGWTEVKSSGPIDEAFGDAIATGDFNGDGRVDFATAVAQIGNKAILNLATADGGWQTAVLDKLRPMSFVTSVAAKDLNRDGRDDLLVGYLALEGGQWRSVVELFVSEGRDGWTRKTLWYEKGNVTPNSLAFGDIDGDGAVDAVCVDSQGRIHVFKGDGHGFFTRDAANGLPEAPKGCAGSRIKLADLDHDGRDEIVASFAGDDCPSGGSIRAWKSVRKGR